MKHCSKILIAGHGYLGEPLAQELVADGHTVFAITKSVGDANANPNGYPLISCDLGNTAAVQTIDFEPEIVIHCASSNRGGAEAYRSVFRDGIDNLHNAFPDSHIFLTSSTSVYGQTDGSEVDEESPAQPDRETGHLLREAEENLIRYQGTVLRLAGIYGPARSVHLKKFLEGTASIETGEISRYLNQIHLDDIISAIKHLISLDARTQTRGHIYNVADDTPMTQRECYEGLAAIFEKPIPHEAEPNMSRKRAWTNKKISIKKLKSLGWTPNFPSFFDAVKNDPGLVKSAVNTNR